MKASIMAALSGIFLLAIASCNADHRGAEAAHEAAAPAATAMADSAGAADGVMSANAPGNLSLNDPSRKIIKTADLRCRVSDVFAATTRMERLAAFTGGQISESRMENMTDDMRRLPYTGDSLRQVESYTTTARLTLRIPVTKLDTVLGDIAANASFINNCSLHLDDVTMRYLSNKLKNDAMGANDAAEQARTLARRSKEAVLSGDYTDERDETRIDRRIENMQLNDHVTYATLTADLYQPQRITQTIVPDIEYLMKPTISQQAGIAINSGWQLLRALLLGLLQIWPLLIIAVAGFALYSMRRVRRLAVRA